MAAGADASQERRLVGRALQPVACIAQDMHGGEASIMQRVIFRKMPWLRVGDEINLERLGRIDMIDGQIIAERLETAAIRAEQRLPVFRKPSAPMRISAASLYRP